MRTSPSKSRTTKSKHLSLGKDEMGYIRDWTDTASMDTDILVSQSMYGARPINMGGYLHESLHKDEKVHRLKKESTKKLRKSSEKSRSRTRERTNISPRSKSVLVTPDRSTRPVSPREYQSAPPQSRMRPEASVSPSTYRDYSPLRSGDLRASTERLELKPIKFSMPVRSPNFRSTAIHRREEQTSPMSKYTSPPMDRGQSSLKSHSEDFLRSHARQSEYRGSNRKSTSPSHGKQLVTRSRKSKVVKEESDKDTSDTDREMRKSPTGIKMEKMHREPTTMYPWKTMIQSRNQKSVAFSDGYSPGLGKPVYESTPAVRSEGVDNRRYVTDKVPSRESGRSNVTQPEEYVTRRVTHYFPKTSPGLKSAPPKPIFGSTDRIPSAHKPPIAPRNLLHQAGRHHQRSRTMPDLRTIGSDVKSLRHSRARRSYDDDMLSVVTSDTEVLLTQPSMPIVDVSPSLTTVSDSSDTIVGSDTESERERYRPSSPIKSTPLRK
jgi:hypothetical protein